MSQSARSLSVASRSTRKSSGTLRPHYYTTFQSSCCNSKPDVPSATQSKDLLPIPTKFKGEAEKILQGINGLLVEELSKAASYTSVIPNIFFEKTDDFQIEKYLIDRVMLRTLEDVDIINWNHSLKRLYPIRTSGNGNCLLHAVLIAMIGVHDSNLYLRDQLGQFMSNNQDLLKTHWRIERLKTDQSYGITAEDSKLDEEWKELCDIVHYENSEDGQAATHLQFLEAVHIFSISNMLRRPIIVLSEEVIRSKTGEAISVNDLYGIYLPILSMPSECINEPIVLAYDRSHFCPLQISDTNLERILDNLLPLYSSKNHILEQTLLPIRFLGDDVTAERSNNLIRDYLRIKEINDSSSPAISILCAELGSKHLTTNDNFFLLYYEYVSDFFKVQKPKVLEDEQRREKDRELEEYVARHTTYDSYGRSIGRYDTSPGRSVDTQWHDRKDRSYDLHQYSDDIRSGEAYIPRNGSLYLENGIAQPQQSPRTLDYGKPATQDSTTDRGYQSLTRKQLPASDPNVFSNLTNSSKITNSVNIQIEGNKSKLNQEQPQSSRISIPVQVIQPRSSFDDPNLTIYEQRRPLRDKCILCSRTLEDLSSTHICPRCEYDKSYPSSYNGISSLPSARSRSTNLYLSPSDRSYTSVISPRPKTGFPGKISCPHCKSLNLSHNSTYDRDFHCSVCNNTISSAYLY